MAERIAGATVASRVELAVSQLDSISTLPCVAVQLFPKLVQAQFSPSVLSDIVESEPALAAKVLSLGRQQGMSLPDERFSVRRVLDKLPAYVARDAILSIKVSRASGPEDDPECGTIFGKRELIVHSLAVACCAKEIAEIISAQADPQLAYCAGLLHDLGKLALQEVMPKSFSRIVEEARSSGAGSYAIEQENLATDHTILGKSLAQRWHLPEAVVLAIWLHHSDTEAICQSVRGTRIAQIVQLADSLARQSDIGKSGSYDSYGSPETMAQSLGIGAAQLQQIRRRLPETVGHKSKALGLDMPNEVDRYCDAAHTAAVQLARKQTAESIENRQLQAASNHLDFAMDFLLSIDSGSTALSIAESFATRWQRFYQTGSVCLYLVPPGSGQSLEAVVVANLGQSKTVLIDVPEDSAPIPRKMSGNFAVLKAHDYVDWLFEQLDTDFDHDRTRLVPVLCGGKALGAIVFELNYPVEPALFDEKFRAATSIVAAVLDLAFARQRQAHFAERFAGLISRPDQASEARLTDDSVGALAEMAAGVAHELNNPLSVISGRAQLLAEAETDQAKQQSLRQIQENASEASSVIGDLIGFAEPPAPRAGRMDVRQMLDEAVQLAHQKANVEQLNVEIEIAEDIRDVYIDSAQVASALANVICNAVESYPDAMGPVHIAATHGRAGEIVTLQISDRGCGMDGETLKKAMQPFFSAKPAGRKRGTGLAYAVRLIQSNKGSLSISSEKGSGTTVRISLPCK
ncbi:MAG: HDOD domain-containing protein [Phycisphaerales bacterium]|nr:MAG: HDOD domain-containing protein [Phycisphaerales bacterium]